MTLRMKENSKNRLNVIIIIATNHSLINSSYVTNSNVHLILIRLLLLIYLPLINRKLNNDY